MRRYVSHQAVPQVEHTQGPDACSDWFDGDDDDDEIISSENLETSLECEVQGPKKRKIR